MAIQVFFHPAHLHQMRNSWFGHKICYVGMDFLDISLENKMQYQLSITQIQKMKIKKNPDPSYPFVSLSIRCKKNTFFFCYFVIASMIYPQYYNPLIKTDISVFWKHKKLGQIIMLCRYNYLNVVHYKVCIKNCIIQCKVIFSNMKSS